MRILSIETTPVHEWTYLSASPRGGSEIQHLPLLSAAVDTLPPDLEALIITSDWDEPLAELAGGSAGAQRRRTRRVVTAGPLSPGA
ncbi:hypothetical protein KYC5002_28830 [Archangium violaceum]|uniref:hypothetical protein n=1 Tax=Archangium violaceum TaxID=83451 RepID=UPI002B2B00EC|nr:hypothetical protein KYC5002_28830 [Archangium gephyra]